MVDFCSRFYKCGGYIVFALLWFLCATLFVICSRRGFVSFVVDGYFVHEEHGGSMVVAWFLNCSYGEGEDCGGYRSLVEFQTCRWLMELRWNCTWWLPRVFGEEDGRLKMQKDIYDFGSQQNSDRIWSFYFGWDPRPKTLALSNIPQFWYQNKIVKITIVKNPSCTNYIIHITIYI